ncbi:MAG: type II secretion system protein [Sedimentisphaeraceae bacterium JB056]
MNIYRKGFTLIELLVVISIIAVLMAIMMPALAKVRQQGQAVVCASNLKQLGLGFTLYSQTYDDFIAPVNTLSGKTITRSNFPSWCSQLGVISGPLSWRTTVLPVILNSSVMNVNQAYEEFEEYAQQNFKCPSIKKSEPQWISYTQNSDVDGWKNMSVKRPAETVMVLDVDRFEGVVYSQMWIDSDEHIDTVERIGKRHPDGEGYNVLFCDGRVDRVKNEDDVIWRRDGSHNRRE